MAQSKSNKTVVLLNGEIASLGTQIAELRGLLAKEKEDRSVEFGHLMERLSEREKIIKNRDDQITRFRDAISILKGQVFDAQMTVARLRGFCDRVADDDAVRENGPWRPVACISPPPGGAVARVQRI